jgi:hypothetical protein
MPAARVEEDTEVYVIKTATKDRSFSRPLGWWTSLHGFAKDKWERISLEAPTRAWRKMTIMLAVESNSGDFHFTRGPEGVFFTKKASKPGSSKKVEEEDEDEEDKGFCLRRRGAAEQGGPHGSAPWSSS